MWINVISDAITSLVFFIISFIIGYIIWKRKDFRRYWWVLLIFLFITGTGISHLIDVLTVWNPIYRLEFIVRGITSIASLGVIYALYVLAPKILTIIDNLSFRSLKDRLNDHVKALEKHKHFIQNLAEASPNKLYVYDINEKKNIYSNKELNESLGYSSDQLKSMGKSIVSELIHPDDVQLIEDYFDGFKSAEDDEVRSLDYRIKDVNGEYRWFYSREKVFRRDKNGNVCQIIGIVMDITDRKEVEEELKESQLFSQKVAETTPDSIFIVDLNTGEVVYINREPEKYLGVTADMLTEWGILHPDENSAIKARYEKYRKLKDDEITTFEFSVKDPNTGKWNWTASREIPFQRDAEGNVTHILSISRDITELKEIQDKLKAANQNLEEKIRERTYELKKRESQLSLITNAIPAMIAYINKDNVCQFANQNFKKIRNVSDSIEGKAIQDGMDEETYNIFHELLNGSLSGNETSAEIELELKSKLSKTISLNFIPDIFENKVRGVVIMGIDLTERIENEKKLEKKNFELLRINNDLDNFIYTASHDLKAPIINMEALVDIIFEGSKNIKSEEQQSLIEMIKTSIERLKITIEELTEISRIQRGVHDAAEDISFNTIINDFKQDYREQIKMDKVTFIEDIQIASIHFSKKNLRSIMYNLLSNAIKYRSERDPVINIKTERLEEGNIILSIKDNGLGLDKRQQGKLFQMFKRLHTHVEGTGVGLYIVKKMIENTGGHIEVESELGKGSTFTIFF
ncbi:MAG: PAS domain S-box protein [Sporocytophaga sp.]|uniref:PAS domain-containing sensor histidine kinase n=1 Tax=Sporocytophaga sp. TaxID=2231183 RepID=UPI001B13220D|nr:PAS domain S-box protein [Sporocytophaga sp.]MBO9701042.1 PAS domain S-box protein [Sporocytophaga sp.]